MTVRNTNAGWGVYLVYQCNGSSQLATPLYDKNATAKRTPRSPAMADMYTPVVDAPPVCVGEAPDPDLAPLEVAPEPEPLAPAPVDAPPVGDG
jgi:hypothetical protein